MLTLETKIEELPRTGPKYLKKLSGLGLKTVRDLFFHFPHRYLDFSQLVPIAKLKPGQTATVSGEISKVKLIRTRVKKMSLLEVTLGDESESINVVWFNQPYLAKTFKEGLVVNLAGKVADDKKYAFFNPAYEIIGSKKEPTHTGRLIPIYHETAGITSRYLRYLIKPLLPFTQSLIKEFLPEEIRKKYQLAEHWWAVKQIHFPQKQSYLQRAKERLAFNELFLIQLVMLRQRQKLDLEKAPSVKFDQKLIKSFVNKLPFKLTDDQKIAAWEILQDIEKTKPMNRLLNGDVGSGKTIVAMIGALQAAKNNYQAALMAPTEILAKQHFQTFRKFLKGQKIKIALLTSSDGICNSKKTKKEKLKKEITKGSIDIVIGTHALIQKDVSFKKLALAIVDEQHRFGVNQRAALQKQVAEIKDGLAATIPHLLSMTATPIPRTLALTIYGDLDISVIRQMPKNRKKVITRLVLPKNYQKAYDFITGEIKKKRQAFVICPLIEKSEKIEIKDRLFLENEVKSVTESYNRLSKSIFPKFKVAKLHGRLKPKEKEEIMAKFKKGIIDILVSTSVVEVGIDVPKATIMIIENAERFGLAQLHQFRGRIGRNQDQSYCFLFTDEARESSRNLKALLNCQNGFELAEKDLEIRGPGSLAGLRQWGIPDLVMASLNDFALIKKSRQAAAETIKNNLLNNELKDKLRQFRKEVHLE